MTEENDVFSLYRKECNVFSQLVSSAIDEISRKSDIEETIDAYKDRFVEVNRISKQKRQEICERRDAILSKWNNLTSEYSEERAKDEIDYQFQPQGLNKMIQKLDETIADSKNWIENFLYSFAKNYNNYIHKISLDFLNVEQQIEPHVDGFAQRRQILNEAKRKMNEFRQIFEEIDRMYNDVKRSGTYKLAKKTPDEIKAKHSELVAAIDKQILALDNDIKLALNLKLTETRFTELRRIFNRCDVNHTGALGLGELINALNTSRKRLSNSEAACLLSNYGDGVALNQFQFLQMMAERDIATRSGELENKPKKVPKGRFFVRGLLHV